MKGLRDVNGEMPADFSTYINTWSLESVVAIALERRLNVLSGTSNDKKAQELIKNIRLFFERSFLYDALPSVWRYYETKGFKDFLKVYDTITEWVRENKYLSTNGCTHAYNNSSIVLHYIELAVKELEKNPTIADTAAADHQDSILRKLLKIDKKAAVVMASDMLLGNNLCIFL
jgi:hypothetical protein